MPWVKGQSGNPKGNVGKHSIRGALRKLAAKKRPDGTTNADEVARLGMNHALGGDLEAIKWVTDQTDGKLPQLVEQSGGLEVVVRRADRNG